MHNNLLRRGQQQFKFLIFFFLFIIKNVILLCRLSLFNCISHHHVSARGRFSYQVTHQTAGISEHFKIHYRHPCTNPDGNDVFHFSFHFHLINDVAVQNNMCARLFVGNQLLNTSSYTTLLYDVSFYFIFPLANVPEIKNSPM